MSRGVVLSNASSEPRVPLLYDRNLRTHTPLSVSVCTRTDESPHEP